MGMQYKERGGGPTVGLANDFVTGLQQLLNTGTVGTAGSPNAGGTTAGIWGVLSDILAGGKGQAGGNIATLLGKQQERDVNQLRSRFGASGGAAFGTPAAFAEGMYRAEAAPQIAKAITEMQLGAISPLLGQIGQFSQLGIAPRQGTYQPSGLGSAIGTVAGIGGAALPFLLPGFPKTGAAGSNVQVGNQVAGGGSGYIDPSYPGQGYIL